MRDTYKAAYLAIVLLLILFAPAKAQTKEDADAAWSRGDYVSAARLYRSLAEQGKASAQHQLGKMYENGEGVPKSQAEAAKWYRLAAQQGHAGAQLYLGEMYLVGEGVPRDYLQAYVWFSLSAAAGQGDFAFQGRDRAADKLSPAQVAGAERRVQAWRPTTAH